MHVFDEKFWLAICFIIFVYLVYKPIKNMVLKSLDSKISNIKKHVLESQKLNDDMVALFENAENQIKQIGELREKMLKEAKESADKIIEQQNKEIEKFLENKHLETTELINRHKLEASQILHSEFCDKLVKLVAVYLQSTKNKSLSDSDIAKKLM